MAAVLLTRETLPRFISRLERIAPDTRPQWGRMTPLELMPHLNVHVRMALGEEQPPDESNWFTRNVLRWMVFHGPPWPKGRIKAPEYFLVPPQETFEAERAKLIDSLRRYAEEAEREPDKRVLNPVFGPCTLRYWGRMLGMHIDHHLRQFGV